MWKTSVKKKMLFANSVISFGKITFDDNKVLKNNKEMAKVFNDCTILSLVSSKT